MPSDFLFAVGTTLASAENFSFTEHFSCQVDFFMRLAWKFICKKFLTRTHRARPGLYIALYRFVYSAIYYFLFKNCRFRFREICKRQESGVGQILGLPFGELWQTQGRNSFFGLGARRKMRA
jgi:hypothetical protein